MNKKKASRIESEYGLSEDKYNEMFSNQEGCCAICGNYMESPHIDHDHTTGKVRGLLCQGCNLGLGLFLDNPTFLRKAATYILDSRLLLEIDNSVYEPISSGQNKIPDWRRLDPSPEQLEEMAHWRAEEMKAYASQTGRTYKTLSNYRSRARKILGISEEE